MVQNLPKNDEEEEEEEEGKEEHQVICLNHGMTIGHTGAKTLAPLICRMHDAARTTRRARHVTYDCLTERNDFRDGGPSGITPPTSYRNEFATVA